MFVLLVSIIVMTFMLSFNKQKSYFKEMISHQLLLSSLYHAKTDLSDDIRFMFGDNLDVNRVSRNNISVGFRVATIPQVEKPFLKLQSFMKNYTNITGINTSIQAIGSWNTIPTGWGSVILNISNDTSLLYSYMHFSLASSGSSTDYASFIRWTAKYPLLYVINITCSRKPDDYYLPPLQSSLSSPPPSPPPSYVYINISYPGGAYSESGYLTTSAALISVEFGAWKKVFIPGVGGSGGTFVWVFQPYTYTNVTLSTLSSPPPFPVLTILRSGLGKGGNRGWANVSVRTWADVGNSTVYATYPVLINATISQNLTVVGRPTLFAS